VNSLFHFPEDKSGLSNLRLMPSFRSAHKLLCSSGEIQNQQGMKGQNCVISIPAAPASRRAEMSAFSGGKKTHRDDPYAKREL